MALAEYGSWGENRYLGSRSFLRSSISAPYLANFSEKGDLEARFVCYLFPENLFLDLCMQGELCAWKENKY